MIKILHVISSLSAAGGVQQMLRNYYEYMDKSSVQFDFVVHGDKIGEMESYFESFGGKVFHITRMRNGIFKSLRQLYRIIQQGDYDIIHDHLNIRAIFSLAFAKERGIKGRVAHAHATKPATQCGKVLIDYFDWVLKCVATDFFACGKSALEYILAGSKKKYNTAIIHNAILPEIYNFSEEKRKAVRKELGLEQAFVVGHVGRFDRVKNHLFIIDIFSELKKSKPHAKLVFAGDGSMLQATKDKAQASGVLEDVLFLGIREDVGDLMQAMDVLLLPSQNEGLGIVAIEAQAADLPCICSTGVPEEVNISGNVSFLPVGDARVWAEEIIKKRKVNRKDCSSVIADNGYDIKQEAGRLLTLYQEIMERE